MIHVVLLTCDRREYTERTIESFRRENPQLDAFRLWHCDDASTDQKIRKLAGRAGFTPLIHTDQRVGVTEMVRRAARRLEHAGAEWMLLLENDWESVRPVPVAQFREIVARHSPWCVRLYGRFKERDEQRPTGTRHRGRGGADPKWQTLEAAGEPYELGSIHWGNPPSIARVREVAWLHRRARREKDAIVKSGEIAAPVARVVQNVFFHIGFARTQGFVS